MRRASNDETSPQHLAFSGGRDAISTQLQFTQLQLPRYQRSASHIQAVPRHDLVDREVHPVTGFGTPYPRSAATGRPARDRCNLRLIARTPIRRAMGV